MACRPRLARLVAALLAAAACSSNRTPDPPKPEAPRPEATIPDVAPDPAQDLGSLLAAYPLGDALVRRDLLALTESASYHLVQTRRAILPHVHRTHRERATILAGRGTMTIAGTSYPAVPGALFRMDAGVVHAAFPEEGEVLVALVCYEPPMESMDEDREAAPSEVSTESR